ncbi:MAG: hypothetical protein SVU32_07350 [Candidatus Nanohaloarchaea archaeon]|nr:hypothetical protein [Candidatus Nanohaloarchaea archaeon]
MSDMDKLLEQHGETGLSDSLRLEHIVEDYRPYRNRRNATYEIDEQRETFNQRVNTFINDHDIYDIEIETASDQYGKMRYEAWILYQEAETHE